MDATTVMAVATSALVMLAWLVLPGSAPGRTEKAAIEPAREERSERTPVAA